jgi:hypothetical protein
MPLNGLVHGRAQVSGRGAGEGVEGLGSHDSFSLNVCRKDRIAPVVLHQTSRHVLLGVAKIKTAFVSGGFVLTAMYF